MIKQDQNINLEAISSELCISADNANEFCGSLVCEPANVNEIQIGNLYIAGEIKSSSRKSAYLINSLASAIKKELYRNVRRGSLESFETSLAKANAFLADIASEGNIDWVGHLHMVCVLFSGGQLHISQTGNAKILLLRNGLLTPIIEDSAQQEAPFPSKTFSNISSGPLSHGDKILITTSELFNALSLGEIKHAISNVSVDKAAENLGELSEIDNDIKNSSIIIIGITQPSAFQSETANTNLSNLAGSKGEAFQNESYQIPEKLSLKEILGNASISSLYSGNTNNLEDNALQNYQNPAKDKESLNKSKEFSTKIFILLKKLFNLLFIFLQNFIKLLLTAFKKTAKILNLLFLKLQNGYSKRKKSHKISENSAVDALDKKSVIIKVKKHPELEQPREKNSLTFSFLKTKTIKLAAAALLMGTGIFGIFFITRKKPAINNENISASINIVKSNDYLNQAKQKRQDAETALIYKDNDKAKSLLIEAAGLIEKIVQLGANPSDITQIQSDIQIQLDQIERIITVQNPFVVADIQKSIGSGFDANIILAEKSGKLAIIDFNSQQIIDIDLAGYNFKEPEKIKLLPQERIIGATIIDNSLGLITNLSTILKINLGDKSDTSRTLIGDIDLSNVASSGSYNENIYLLNGKGQINKISSSGQASQWLKNNSGINSDLISMAIDGDIFALGSDGTIFKLSGGKLKSAMALSPDIAPKTSGKIFASADSDRLFILDPSTKKIIVTNKKGTVISQYKSEKFDNLKSIYADAKANSLYVLNGNVIYRVDM